MSQPRLVSVILPVHNQAEHIKATVEEYLGQLAGLPPGFQCELLLVENASRDSSRQVCDQLAKDHPTVRVISADRAGWGHAVRAGLAEAKGDFICYTNSARTSAAELFLSIVYGVTYGDVVVKANRKIRDNWRRRLGSLLYNIEVRVLFDLSNWDVNGTPKVFPRHFEQLVRLRSDDDLIDAEFCVVCRRQGYPMIEIPTFSARRHGGRSTTGYGSALRLYWGAMRLRRRLA